MKPFPHLTQLDAMDCGATCLRMIAKHYKNESRKQKAERLRHESNKARRQKAEGTKAIRREGRKQKARKQ